MRCKQHGTAWMVGCRACQVAHLADRGDGSSAVVWDEGASSAITLRDFFAGMAMAGCMANGDKWSGGALAMQCGHAYELADAMLEARKGGE